MGERETVIEKGKQFCLRFPMVKKGVALVFLLLSSKRQYEKSETRHNSERVKERQSQKIKNIFYLRCSYGLKRPRLSASVLLFLSSWVHEKERQNNKWRWGYRVTESLKYFCLLSSRMKPAVTRYWSDDLFIALCSWNQRHVSSKDLLSDRFRRKICIYLILNNILDKVIVHVEQRFKTLGKFRFVEFLNPKLFSRLRKKKNSNGSVFNFGCM